MFDMLGKGLRCTFRNKVRSALTITGIAVGVCSVMLVSAVGRAGKISINNEMTDMGMDSLVISSSSLDEEALAAVKSVNNVSDAMPLINKLTSINICNENSSAMIWGVNENADKVIDLEVKYGRLLNRGDIAQQKRVCVIDEAIAYNSYSRGNITGKKVKINLNGYEEEFEIVGVVKNGVNMLQSMMGGFIPDFVYIPYTVMQDYTQSDEFDNITVRLDSEKESIATAEMIENVLSVRDDNVSVENLLSQKDKLNKIMDIASIALSFVAGISIVVSGISIMTVMLVAVSERTREIGIKKSIGATTYNIMLEFLSESVVITLIGSVLGILVGICGSLILSLVSGIKFAVDVKEAAGMVFAAIILGIIFGVYPAIKAARLNPADALRME